MFSQLIIMYTRYYQIKSLIADSQRKYEHPVHGMFLSPNID